jgi:inositol-phosphate transport system substrate-binding protein
VQVMDRRITRHAFIKKAAVAGVSMTALPSLLAACGGGTSEGPAQGENVNLTAWTGNGTQEERWRVDGPAQAANDVDTYNISVDPVNDSSKWEDYKRKFTLAADAGEAPNIVVSGHEDVAVWSQAEYIVPFDDCRSEHSEFDDVKDSIWNAASFDGKIWGVPQDVEVRPMYFNKDKLAELGWSQGEIDSLPQRIQNGEFTLDDMVDTAKQAVDKGVVDSGYGYWHRPSKGGDFLQYYVAYGGRLQDEGGDKLVVGRDPLVSWYAFQRKVVEEGITPENYIGTTDEVWHDTVSHGKALFWNGGIWNWADWAKNYVKDLGGDDYLFSFVGYALQPSGTQGSQGVTLSHPLLYMITTDSASGASNQKPSCDLLAKTTTPEINTPHANSSTHLGILKSQADYPDYTDNPLLSDVGYMLDYNFYQPNHAEFGPYFDALWDNMVKAENGEMSPDDAADQAISLVKVNVSEPDQVIFE